jgi:hypothetical protein
MVGEGPGISHIHRVVTLRGKRKEEDMWKCLHWTLNHGWGLVFSTFTKLLSEATKNIR